MPDKPDNILEVNNLQVSFYIDSEKLSAVQGVSFTVKRGQILAIVGESGCGKSVTAMSLLRLIDLPGKIDAGKITFFPADQKPIEVISLKSSDPLLYDLRGGLAGMIFQEPMTALSPVYTVGNQIKEALDLHRRVAGKQAEQQVIEMLRKVGIPNPAKVFKLYPHEISGGMRQRAVIAMALIAEPSLLIADEPTTALDVTIQAQILILIKKLQQQLGISVLLITHDLGVVAQVADSVAVMYMGRIVESAPVRDLIKSPRHPYTMALLRSLPGLSVRKKPLVSIKGSVPPLSEIPQGCPFHPRCDYSQKGRCDIGDAPVLRNLTDTHCSACLRSEELKNNE
jgi:oligopeptide/dipeptide ABC transporter ATP-binding protein